MLSDAPQAPDESPDTQPLLLRMLSSERVVVALVVGFLALIAVAGVGVAFIHDASKPIGTPLRKADREAIEQANCPQLAVLFDRWQNGADSVEPSITAFRLVNARMKTLGCPAPTTAPFPTSNFPGGPP